MYAKSTRRTWPIAYGRRRERAQEGSLRAAWALFLGLGVPFGLMAVLTVLARAGIFVDLFRPLWQPWPPDVLKPFVGLAGFAGTLAYLAYRAGHRSGYRAGSVAGVAAARNEAEGRYQPQEGGVPATDPPVPAPPPPPAPTDSPTSL